MLGTIMNTIHRVLFSSLAFVALTLALLTAPAAAQNRGADITGTITDRDNTRASGTVFDSSGQPMTDVDIWIQNDDAPAERMRAKARKTGSYLARGLIRLYDERNVTGISLRLTFEKPGYQTVVAVVDVAKNGLAAVYPILWPEGAEPEMSGVTMLLVGRIQDDRGKGVKNAKMTVTGAEVEGFHAAAEVAKDGSYEVLLWNAPSAVRIEIAAAGIEPFVEEVALSSPERFDLAQVARRDFEIQR